MDTDTNTLSKLIEHFIAIEVYMKEDGDGPTPLVKKQYVYPEAEDQDFFNNISLFAFPSEKTYDDSKIYLGKKKNRNDVFKDSSKDYYDITEVNNNKPKKTCFDDVKCHDFILTNQYGEKVYASCIRTRKIPLKWDVNNYLEKDTKDNNYIKEGGRDPFGKSCKSNHRSYTETSQETLCEEFINSFSQFKEYGKDPLLKKNHDKDTPIKTLSEGNKEDNETFMKCRKNKQFSASNNALSKIPTVPTSSYFLTSSLRNSTRTLNKMNDNDSLGHLASTQDKDKFIPSAVDNTLSSKPSAIATTVTVTATSSGHNSKTVLNSSTTNDIHSSLVNQTKSTKTLDLTPHSSKPKNYYCSDPENINSSTACILSQYTNIKSQCFRNSGSINSSSYYIDRSTLSRSNLQMNSFDGTHSCSTYNIDSGGGIINHHHHNYYHNQIRQCSNKFNGSNAYNYTQSTSNLNSSNDSFARSYHKNEFGSHQLYPKNNNNTSFMDGSIGLQPLHEYGSDDDDDDDDGHHHLYPHPHPKASTSIIDSLNLDFISMESLVSEKMLQKQQTNQSLLYNLDLCMSSSMKSSLFSMNNNSVNSLFSKKTVTSYILISRRPIFTIMQKCLLEMYLLSKYSLKSNDGKVSGGNNNNSLYNYKNNKKSEFLNPKLIKEGIIESFLAYLMHTIFLPSINSPFTVEIELPLSKEVVKIFPQNKTEIRPLYHSVFTLFQLLSINNIISIFTHMTLEKSVIFYSENPVILTSICETFLSFLEPLEWRMVYIPIVPESVIESLQEAPITFIMGYINSNGNDTYDTSMSSTSNHNINTTTTNTGSNDRSINSMDSKNSKKISSSSNGEKEGKSFHQDTIGNFRMNKSEEEILYVNLDTDELFNLSEQRLRLPYESRLRNDLRQIMYQDFPSLQKEAYFDGNTEYIVKKEECVEKIRKCFYHWFVTILYNYQSFFLNDGDFNISAFRSRFSDSCINYINRFTETSMFTHFIEKKYNEKTSLLSSSSIKPQDYFDLCSNKLLGIPYFEKHDKINSMPELNVLTYNTLLLNLPRKDPAVDVKASSTIYGGISKKDVSVVSSKNTLNSTSSEKQNSSKSNREVLGLTDSNEDLQSSLFSLNTTTTPLKSKNYSFNSNNKLNSMMPFTKFGNINNNVANNNDNLYHFDVNTFEFFNTKYQNNLLTPTSIKNNKMTRSFPLLFNNINQLIDLQINYYKSLVNEHASTFSLSSTFSSKASVSSSETLTQPSNEAITTLPLSNSEKEEKLSMKVMKSSIANTYHALKEILPLSSFKGGYCSSQSNISKEMNLSTLSAKSFNTTQNSSSSLTSIKNLSTTGVANELKCQTKSLSTMINQSNSILPLPCRCRLQQLLWIRGLLLQEYSLDVFQSILDFCWAYNFNTNETLLEMIENSFLQLSNHQKCRLFKKLNKNFFLAFDKIFYSNIDIKTMYEAYIQCISME
ncbi:hypothetical protein BCR36DRAFT_405050 [Piromyces finnis]|uniref:UDENN domain-containing protein n=1 Tax=Piromyces finnis TaxID=1754191 RepID=A0A1Y1V6V4_9FUNG|nr:hypothetical protein BCR36DRAFT_405050 [Piromyces finnis]|eukprot:ORX48451.1 hypothetical protein BCR36DRAFT_405050 [Piromyces finnis]